MGGLAGVGAAQGIQAWMQVFDRSAASVTGAAQQFGSDGANQTSSGDLIDGMVGMNMAAAGVKANIAVFRTADEMLGSLLDMKA